MKAQAQELMESNKLIAEFWEMELGDDKTMYYDDAENLHPPTPVDELKFHTSWDWLMPVVEKCLATDERTEFQHHFINDSLLTCDIEVVYDRVVEFIKDCEKKKPNRFLRFLREY